MTLYHKEDTEEDRKIKSFIAKFFNYDEIIKERKKGKK